jgi:prevent-host-death family protein
MLDISRDIQSLTEFKKNTSEFVDQLKQTGEPVILTINGKAELVVQDAAAYQKLREIAEQARVLEGIRQGLADMNAGRTVSLDEFKQHARAKSAITKNSEKRK